MKRLIGVLAVMALIAGAAQADVAPPKGLKRVVLDNKITTEKEYADLAFYLMSGRDKVEPVKLDPKTPLVIAGSGRGGAYRQVQVIAVPKEAVKKYESEKDFLAALVRGQVEGIVRSKVSFSALATIKDTDPRKTVVEEYKLEKIDPKDGMVFTAVAQKDPTATPPKDGQEEEEATAFTPRNGAWVAGVAATFALVLAGFWLARRKRE